MSPKRIMAIPLNSHNSSWFSRTIHFRGPTGKLPFHGSSMLATSMLVNFKASPQSMRPVIMTKTMSQNFPTYARCLKCTHCAGCRQGSADRQLQLTKLVLPIFEKIKQRRCHRSNNRNVILRQDEPIVPLLPSADTIRLPRSTMALSFGMSGAISRRPQHCFLVPPFELMS